MSYINLKERYFLAKKLMRLLDLPQAERSLIASILKKFGCPDIFLTADETHFLKRQISNFLDEAMESRDDYHIEFLSQLQKKI